VSSSTARSGELPLGHSEQQQDASDYAPPPTRPSTSRLPARLTVLGERLSGFSILLVVADLVAGVVAELLTNLPWFSAVALFVVLIICRMSARLYRRRLRLSYLEDFPRSLASVIIVLGVSVGIYMLITKAGPADRDALNAVAGFLALSELLRAMVFGVSRLARTKLHRGDRTLVLGSDSIAVRLLSTMREHPEFGLIPIGFLDLDGRAGGTAGPSPVPERGADQAARLGRGEGP